MIEIKKTFTLHVPATALFGSRTKRTCEFEFPLPHGLDINRDINPEAYGAYVVQLNLNGLEEVERVFHPINNGVRLLWTLKNDDSSPFIGKFAEITVGLSGLSNDKKPIEAKFSEKYDAIRKRFFDDFFYDGRVADYIDREDNRISFGDQTTYMGQALIFLSSEAKLNRLIGQSDADSVIALRRILYAIDELDLAAEPYFGSEPSLNGFIARDDIRGPGDTRLKNRWSKVKSDGDGTKPENVSPSGDQIFGLMNGLWFVVNLSGDPEASEHAKQISQRLFDYVRKCRFELTRPDGVSGKQVSVSRGADMRWLSSLLHGLNKSITGNDEFDDCKFDSLPGAEGTRAVASFWDKFGTQAADLMRIRVKNPLDEKLISVTFRAHIVLMAIAPSDVWAKDEFERAALSVNHHLAVLFYCIAHKCKPSAFYFEDVELIMDKCPETGPRGDLPVRTGWQRDNRWVRSSELDQPQGDTYEYFGVDFLMLHNLAMLVFL